jgi:translin
MGVWILFNNASWRDVVSVISKDLELIDNVLREKDAAREEAIRISREITRLAGSVVSYVHVGKWQEAKQLLSRLEELVDKLNNVVDKHPDLKYSGLVYNALSEYVEACLFYSVIVERRVPEYTSFKVSLVPYLQGLGDLVGELRRYIIRLLDKLRVKEAEDYLELMEHIYEHLRALDYPDALIPGVKHKVDVASRLIEDTRVLILSTKNSLRALSVSEM